MDLTQLIESNNVGPLTLNRAPDPIQNEFGDFDPAMGPPAIALDPVAVHTLDGRDLEQLAEADRHVEAIRVYATVQMFVGDGGQTSDRIEYRGRSWRVTRVEDYELQGAVFMAIATLEDAA